MITLNLLPYAQKEKIKKMAIYSIFENLIAGIFVTITIVSIILLLTENSLQNNYSNFINKTSNPSKNIQKLNLDIKKINADVKESSLVQKNYIKWSTFLIDFNQLIPNDIQITNLEINAASVTAKDTKSKKSSSEKTASKTLKIAGEAKTRDDLLLLRKNLESSSLFSSVQSPIKNMLSPNNIEFSFDLTLKD